MGKTYNREKCVAYAMRWWNGKNPAFIAFKDDCTSYVSQCLLAGGMPMTYIGQKDKGWWYQGHGKKNDTYSYSWSTAHSLRWYLSSAQGRRFVEERANATDLEPGDMICYDFDGDGRWQHNTIVVAKNWQNEPLINAHTYDSMMRYWAYQDSPAATQKIRYLFWHIRDIFPN